MRRLFSILLLLVFFCQNISLADSGTFCLAYESPLDKTSKKDLRDGVSRLAHEGSGVIGKVSERAGVKYAQVVDSQGVTGDVRLNEIKISLGLIKSGLPEEVANDEIVKKLFRRGIDLKNSNM